MKKKIFSLILVFCLIGSSVMATEAVSSRTERVDIKTVRTIVYFSEAVSDMGVISVMKNGETVTDGWSAELAEDGMSMTIKFEESRNGGTVYDVIIKDMPFVGNDGFYAYTYTVPDYAWAEYGYESGLTVYNNSSEEMNYYAAAINEQTGAIISSEGTLEAEGVFQNSEVFGNSATVKTILWNDKMQTISNDSDIPVSGAEYFDNDYSFFENLSGQFIIRGLTKNNSDKVFNLKLTKNSSDGEVLYLDTVKTNENGYYEFVVELPENVRNESFEMYAHIGGDELEEIKSGTIYVASESETELYIEKIINGVLETKDIANIVKAFNLGLPFYSEINHEELASHLNSCYDQFSQLNQIGEIKKQFEVQTILYVLSKSEIAQNLLFDGTSFLHDGIMEYSAIDKTLLNIYKYEMTEAGKTAVINKLIGQLFNNADELRAVLEEQIYINAFNYNENGYEYIRMLLEIGSNIGMINIPGYFNLTTANQMFVANELSNRSYFSNIVDIEMSVRSIVMKFQATTTPSTSGGSFGGGGGGYAVTIPDSTTKIADYEFSGVDLTEVVIPETVTSIGKYAFSGSSLTKISISEKVTYIGEGAFSECDMLSEITVSENNPNYCSIDGHLFTKDGKKLIQYAFGKNTNEYAIPDGVTEIGERAFYVEAQPYLTKITFPLSLEKIGGNAFSDSWLFSEIHISDLAKLCEIELQGVNAVPKGNLYLNDTSVSDLVIPDGVKNINSYAFAGFNSYFNSVTLPKSIETISDWAFLRNTINTVYYGGTIDDWQNVNVGYGNDNVEMNFICSIKMVYDANGGGTVPPEETVLSNMGATVSSEIPKRTGHRFLGWTTDKTSVNAEYQPGDTIDTTTENITLYAIWEKISYTEISLTEYSGGDLITVTPYGVPDEAVVIIACYKDNRMISCDIGTSCVGVGYDTVKVFVFESLATMKPLTEVDVK